MEVGIRAPTWRSTLLRIAIVPGILGLAWWADRWDLGGGFVPGNFAGSATASAIGWFVARRWEADHGALLISVIDTNHETHLYALPDTAAMTPRPEPGGPAA